MILLLPLSLVLIRLFWNGSKPVELGHYAVGRSAIDQCWSAEPCVPWINFRRPQQWVSSSLVYLNLYYYSYSVTTWWVSLHDWNWSCDGLSFQPPCLTSLSLLVSSAVAATSNQSTSVCLTWPTSSFLTSRGDLGWLESPDSTIRGVRFPDCRYRS